MVKTIGKKEITQSIKLSAISAPTPEAGLLYFDSTATKLKVCEDGSTFSQVGGLSTKQLDNAAEVTATVTEVVVVTTTFTPSNATIIGFRIKCDAKSSDISYTPEIVFKVTGSTLGTKYITGRATSGSVVAPYIADTTNTGALVYTLSPVYATFALSGFAGLPLNNEPTTIAVTMRQNAGTGSIKNLTSTIFMI